MAVLFTYCKGTGGEREGKVLVSRDSEVIEYVNMRSPAVMGTRKLVLEGKLTTVGLC